MRKLYENFHILYFQKRIVSAETRYSEKAPQIWKKSTNLVEIRKERQIKLGNFVKRFGSFENISTLKLICISFSINIFLTKVI